MEEIWQRREYLNVITVNPMASPPDCPNRCNKCLENHPPGECQRKTREGAAKCVNYLGPMMRFLTWANQNSKIKILNIGQSYQVNQKMRSLC